MKKIIALCFIVLLSSCGVTIRSVVDTKISNAPYKNILIVITYENGVTKNFTNKLKEKLET
ncbi:hypothetical protein [uncultured Aquimarina sp.]|uniref:hypothetical protein n=1 Tax=uncultured Aquimarina sp. TaxID=575652 RepID=UPI0026279113|nr:hypothetical protein [uncultured Aquimarina sp.]